MVSIHDWLQQEPVYLARENLQTSCLFGEEGWVDRRHEVYDAPGTLERVVNRFSGAIERYHEENDRMIDIDFAE